MTPDPGDQRPRRQMPRPPRSTDTGPETLMDIDVHALTGAYAVDALDELERVRFERHLETCSDCVAEVRSFTETTSRLGAAQAMTPPPALRAAVLEEIGRTRQVSPQGSHRRAPDVVVRSSRWLAVAAAGLLVAAAGLGGLAVDATRDASRSADVASVVTSVLTDPDRTVTDADFAGGRAAVVTAGDEVVVLADGVAAPPSDSVYVLWMLDAAGSPRSAGVVRETGDGSFVGHTTGFHSGETLAVTVEQDPSTTLPHGDVVMATA